jgi:hypothetical protein
METLTQTFRSLHDGNTKKSEKEIEMASPRSNFDVCNACSLHEQLFVVPVDSFPGSNMAGA